MSVFEIFEKEIKPQFRFSTETSFHKYLIKDIILKSGSEETTELLRIIISTLKEEENISLRIMNALTDIMIDIDTENVTLREKIEAIYLTAIEKKYEEVKTFFISPPPVITADPKDFEEWDVELSKVTLGERKSFAKRLSRRMVERLLRDPSPDVIRILLLNPRLYESDVISLGARRPNFGTVLMEIYKSYRWKNNIRIRTTLVRNPYCLPLLSIKLAYLLPKIELIQIKNDTEIHPLIREIARYLIG